MFQFHLCSYGSCKKKASFIAKTGEGFCVNHSFLLIEEEGMNFFWPHYHRDIIRKYLEREKRKETREQKIEKEIRLTPSIEGLIFHEIAVRQVKLEL